MMGIRKGKIFFLYLEFLGLSGALGLFAAFIHYLLGDLLGIAELVNILLYWLLYGLVAAVLAYVVRRIKGGWTWKDLGFRTHRSWGRDIWYGFVIASLIYILTFPLEVTLLPSVAKLAADSMSSLLQLSLIVLIPAVGILSLIFGFITGAFHEEIWYRGYLQGLFTREAAPAVGFFFSLIIFSLGHYFSHPEWSLLNVLNTVPHAIFYCLAFYATRSLLVCMVIHTLSSFIIPTIAIPLYSKGLHGESYITMAVFWGVFLVICILGKAEIRELILKTIELFKKSGWKMSLLGILLGVIGLLFVWGRQVFQSQVNRGIYLLVLSAFTVLALGASFLYKSRNSKI